MVALNTENSHQAFAKKKGFQAGNKFIYILMKVRAKLRPAVASNLGS